MRGVSSANRNYEQWNDGESMKFLLWDNCINWQSVHGTEHTKYDRNMDCYKE